MALTGHKDVSMLMRYSHTREEAKKSAIEKLGGKLKSYEISNVIHNKHASNLLGTKA
jgi:hypothetical protein